MQLGGHFLRQRRQLLAAQVVSLVVQPGLLGPLCILDLMPESSLQICSSPRLVSSIKRVTLCCCRLYQVMALYARSLRRSPATSSLALTCNINWWLAGMKG